MKRITKLLTVVALALAAVPAIAQETPVSVTINLGHCNTDSILMIMPEYKTAMAELEAVQAQYEVELQEMQSEIKTKAEALQANGATYSALRVQKERSEIATLTENLQAYAQTAQQDLGVQEQAKLGPVLKKLQEAINQVGKDKGYDYILDTARGTVIFKNDARDITNDVLAVLGLI